MLLTYSFIIYFSDNDFEYQQYPQVSITVFYLLHENITEFIRGGVEDTRLEAKAKDTKKIRGQGQGQPFRGQNLSRPRTGMLEAKDQGHKRKCSPKKKKKSSQKFFRQSPKKKKVFTKIFQAISKKKKKKGLHKNFASDLHEKTLSQVQETTQYQKHVDGYFLRCSSTGGGSSTIVVYNYV